MLHNKKYKKGFNFVEPLLRNIKYFLLKKKVTAERKVISRIMKSTYISRDLSWLEFNYRVLDQARNPKRNIFEKLKFLAITQSNMDEFFMIRVGSLYNYIDYKRERIDNSGLRELPFKKKLFEEVQIFKQELYKHFFKHIEPEFKNNGFIIASIDDLSVPELEKVNRYYIETVYPMLTPMLLDNYHVFPVLLNKLLYFGVVTRTDGHEKRLSFVQIPQNLNRFYEIERGEQLLLLPLEDIIRWKIADLYRNIEIESATVFRIIRNGDFDTDESDDADTNFIEEMKRNLKKRKTGRVVRIDIEEGYPEWFRNELKKRCRVDDDNFFVIERLLDFTSFWSIIKNKRFKSALPAMAPPVVPLSYPHPLPEGTELFDYLKQRDIMLHLPFNSIDYLVNFLEAAAADAQVMSIKITIYRLAKNSRISNALYKAAENGKHVSVLFEVKARFDEENNIAEAQRLQKAGCFVIYGLGNVKTHAKILQIIRKDDFEDRIVRYSHMASGNYNEDTARLYTDVSILSAREEYADDISELFNVVTGHSSPKKYKMLITAPLDMRAELINLVNREIHNAKLGLKCGIVLKMNSLQDDGFIDALYAASAAGVPVKLIIRGICCLRPGREGLSKNIQVKSIVGDLLEHTRLYYFQNNETPELFGSSADAMVRSFERRIECAFKIIDPQVLKESFYILQQNLLDNVNSYHLDENGEYKKQTVAPGEKIVDVHKLFYNVNPEDVSKVTSLF